jgi:hypothetical protein
MGRAKAWAMEQAGQGFGSGDTRVCKKCIADAALISFIAKTGKTGLPCSYCAGSSPRSKTVAFDDFVRRMLEGIETEWSDPNDEGVAWEQGWVGNVLDSYDLLTEELEIDFATEELFHDLHRSLSDRQWCQRNFYELEPHEALIAGWEEFARVVKHESRYVLARREDPRAEGRGLEEIAPADFLDALSRVIANSRLYANLAAETTVCRLRMHGNGSSYTHAHELGPPPAKFAKFPNRMSAAGITAFYGAFDKDTAVAETVRPAEAPLSAATLGHFKLLRDLHLIDFTKLPPVPSIFAVGSRTRRQGILFLRSFLRDFTAPIEKDGREHIDYVPTQVVAEYLRFIHRGRNEQRIDGILYRSARNEGAQACVLFAGPDEFCDKGDQTNGKIAMLLAIETFDLA